MVLLIVQLETRRRALCAAKRCPRWHLAISATIFADRIASRLSIIARRDAHTVYRRASIDRADLNLHRRCDTQRPFLSGGEGGIPPADEGCSRRLRRSRYDDALFHGAANLERSIRDRGDFYPGEILSPLHRLSPPTESGESPDAGWWGGRRSGEDTAGAKCFGI